MTMTSIEASRRRCERGGRAAAAEGKLVQDDFVTLLAHDIRSPLNILGMTSDVLAHRVGRADPTVAHLLDVMQSTLEQMKRLVDDVVMLADAGPAVDSASNCAVERVLQEAITDQGAMAELYGIELRVSTQASDCHAGVDRAGLLRILANLLTNAIRYTPRGGRVLVTWCCEPDAVSIAVEDTGPGLPPETVAAVLQGRAQRRGKKVRQPLGLLIVHRLVTSYGGAMQFETLPERGARVIVRFRRATAGSIRGGGSPLVMSTV
jgi:signal transduction histidine kinase